MIEHTSGCLVCGEDLIYTEVPEGLQCFYCNGMFEANVKCLRGHYVCDRCHSMPANELIEQFCIATTLEDPLKIATALMKNPSIKMHGPEHHFLVAAVLLAAYYNTINAPEQKREKIDKARKRSELILGGFCGSHGNCGAAVGTGIFISLITGATPLSEKEWRLSNLMTAKSLCNIAEKGGPRCCKRNTSLAILEAVDFVTKHLDVSMKAGKDIKCLFNQRNKECIRNACPFYPQE